MKKYLYSLALLSVFFGLAMTGCLLPAKPGSHIWFYTFGTGSGLDSLTPVSFLELRPDGSFTSDLGRFEYGHWGKKDRQLMLTNQEQKTFIYTIGKLTADDMELTVAKDRVGHFESKSLPSDNLAEDPFSLANNRWRISAKHKESDSEIRARLYNHCQFWEFYFKWAQDKKLDIVDVRSTPTPIKIYGNGFGLKPFDNLPQKWKSYFFDDEDCQKANDILKQTFEHQTIAWSNSNSKYKMFLSAFQQLKSFLR
jgi:hypothetical protein